MHIGTGFINASSVLAEAPPQCTVIHVEPKTEMYAQAVAEIDRGPNDLDTLSSGLLSPNFFPRSVTPRTTHRI
jgi:hypothetical protein